MGSGSSSSSDTDFLDNMQYAVGNNCPHAAAKTNYYGTSGFWEYKGQRVPKTLVSNIGGIVKLSEENVTGERVCYTYDGTRYVVGVVAGYNSGYMAPDNLTSKDKFLTGLLQRMREAKAANGSSVPSSSTPRRFGTAAALLGTLLSAGVVAWRLARKKRKKNAAEKKKKKVRRKKD